MGTKAPNSSPLLQDLKVSVHRSTIITPSEPTEKKSLFLSNIDQVLTLEVETVHFFPSNSKFPLDIVANKLEAALGKLLVTYDFVAGRLKLNPENGRLEIDCNRAGVPFSVATSGLSLEEIGNLVYPNPAFGQLVIKVEAKEMEGRPLLTVQVTSFKCGAFAIGMSNSHTTFDGISVKMFLDNLAALASDKPLAVVPFNNRLLMAARSPPVVSFPHSELLALDDPNALPKYLQMGSLPKLEFKIFKLTTDAIAHLKEKAKLSGVSGPAITSFNVVTAHIWRCKVLSMPDDNPDKQTTVLYAIDIRRRLEPPLPASYTGNAVLNGYGAATRRELAEGSFHRVVEAVWEGSKRMTDEYARSSIDWSVFHRGIPHGDVMVTSWWKLGLSEVDFPWGRATYTCPVAKPFYDIVVLLPGMVGDNTNGVNAQICAHEKEQMEKFETLFHEFLA